MLGRILNLFKGQAAAPTATAKRLIPDPARVVAGFHFWMIWRREETKNPDDAYKIQKAFLADLERQGMKRNEAGIPLDSPFAGQIFKQLKKWKTEPNYQGSASMTFKLRSDVKPDWEWFEIRPNPCSNPPLDYHKYECRADHMPGRESWIYRNCISEQCKESITAAGLTGLEFTWVSDVGRYQARQWFHAMATEPLWRGLKHPVLVDKNNDKGRSNTGIPTADALMEIFPKSLGLHVFPQTLRKFVPSTDFAFAKYSDSAPVTGLIMCCTARARKFLLDQGVLTQKDFVPIWIWDSPPEGAELSEPPDKSKLLPYPLIEPEWKWVQEQLPARRAAFLSNPKPVFNLTAVSVLEKFQGLRRQDSPPHLTAIQKSAPNSNPKNSNLKIPALWQRVLDISENFTVYTEKSEPEGWVYGFEIVPRHELVEFNKIRHEWIEREFRDSGLSEKACDYTYFANSDSDLLAFDLRCMTDDGDCRVVEWCHDGFGKGREWPSITQLLAESVEFEETAEAL